MLRLLPAILAAWLLGAHFLRSFTLPLVTVCLVLPFLLLIRRPWTARVYQVAMVIGAIAWTGTAMQLYRERQAEGEPVGRLLLIMAGVIGFTLLAALLFETPALRRRYGLGDSRPQGGAGV